MNLPANLPAAATSTSAPRAERPAERDAGMKFDDILLPKKTKASSGPAEEQGDKPSATWSWTRHELSKNRMGWQDEADGAKVDAATTRETDEATAAEGLAAEEERGEDESSHVETDPKIGLDVEVADKLAGTRDDAGPNNDESAPAESTGETDEAAEQPAALAAERAAAADLKSRTPVQGDGEARQGAAMAAGDDRRLESRLASRERAASIGEHAANKVEPAMREASRPAPTLGNAESQERLAQRLNTEGEARQAEGRIPASLKSGLASREDNLRADPFAKRVTVVSSQTAPITPPAPAPASLGLSSASAQVTAAIGEDIDQVSRAAASQIEAQDAAGSRNRPVHTLQIQLQPADLGRVNARMSIDGSQLSVVLQVETEQARTALAKDADAILKSLKAAGFEIDKVTIQQVQPTPNTPQTGTPERGANAFASQGNGTGESGDQGRQRGTGNGDGYAPREGHDGALQNDPRGGLFI